MTPSTSHALLPWYGIRTRSNHEKVTAASLRGKGFTQYLPVYRAQSRRFGRMAETEKPLFPGYVFCRFDSTKRLPIITTPGVVSVVGFGNAPSPIEDCEIEAIQAILDSGAPAEPCPFLHQGQRIRITRGALEGIEGTLLMKRNSWRMVVSISMLQRSISVEIDRDQITQVS